MRSTTSQDALLKTRPTARRGQKAEWLALHSFGASVATQSDIGELTAGVVSKIYPSGSVALASSVEQFSVLSDDSDMDLAFDLEPGLSRYEQLNLEQLNSSGPFALPSFGAGLSPRTMSVYDFDVGAPQLGAPALRLNVPDVPLRYPAFSVQVASAPLPSEQVAVQPFTLSVQPTPSLADSTFSCMGIPQGTLRLGPAVQWPNTTLELNSLQLAKNRYFAHGSLESMHALFRDNTDLKRTPLGGSDLASRIAHRLARIPEMPRAHDSVLPSPELIDAALRVADYLPTAAILPQIEIDDSTGSISFVWRDDRSGNVFSLEFPNARSAIGVGVGPEFTKYRPWRYSVAEERKIVGELQSSKAVKRLMLSGDELPR